MSTFKISIAKQFTKTPGPRYIHEGKFSGEQFRLEYLYPLFIKAMQANQKIEAVLDGTAGYGTSFLEESFGGLVRQLVNKNGMDVKKARSLVNDIIIIISEEEEYLKDDIKSYVMGIPYEMVY